MGGSIDVFVPMMMKAQATPTWDSLRERHDRWLQVFGRLKPRMTEASAQAALEPLYKQFIPCRHRDAARRARELRDGFSSKSHSLCYLPHGELRNWAGGGSPFVGIDGDGGSGSVGCVREGRESVDRTCSRTPEGDRGSRLARSFAVAGRASIVT